MSDHFIIVGIVSNQSTSLSKAKKITILVSYIIALYETVFDIPLIPLGKCMTTMIFSPTMDLVVG